MIKIPAVNMKIITNSERNSMFIPKIFLFILLCSYHHSIVYSSIACHPQQRVALLHSKQKFTISNDVYYNIACKNQRGFVSGNYSKIMTWNASTDCCMWDGVTCDKLTGDVISLDLSCSKLKGTIDSNTTLFHIPRLRMLNLAYNDLGASYLPPEIGRLASSLTHLNLSNTLLSGPLPSEILHLSKMVSLDLSYNRFDSILEPQFLSKIFENFTQLRELSLRYVMISSPLPSNLNLSSSLTFLDLFGTQIYGKLPDDIFNLPNLQNLDLSLNIALNGSLPEVNRSINSPLKVLDLSQTGIEGDIPDSIVYLRSLEVLNLYDCELSGFLPRFLGNLTHLVTLDIGNNNLITGAIPLSVTSLTELVTLHLSDNSLTGLPASSNITGLKRLVHLDLSRNILEGVIPAWFSLLASSEEIRITSNMLSGVIPSGVFKLSSLKELDFSYNNLEGTIPSVLKLPSLNHIMLNDNQLVGQLDLFDQDLVPQSFLLLNDIIYIALANNNFSGVWELDILLSSLTELQGLDLSFSGLSVVINNANHSVNPDFYALRLASCKLTVFPEFLKSTEKLEILELSHNEIHGQLPNWTAEMWSASLTIIDLSHNFITGLRHLPWRYLMHLKLESNFIQGPFPLSICNMSFIQIVDLSNNSFSGTIPKCFGYFNENLVMVDLGGNAFHGTFPVISGCERLGELNLNGNLLHGKLPRSLAKCVALEVLDFGNNKLNDEFPHWLATLPELKVLVLRSNGFNGSITSSPMSAVQFSKLRILDLSQNRFSGALPSLYFRNFKAMMNVSEEGTEENYAKSPIGSNIYYHTTVVMKGVSYELVRILTILTAIDLSDNRFEGSIPGIIGSLKSMKVLNLSHNSLTGHIPDVLGSLSKIESLDLSWNQLAGEIPQHLTDLTFLAVLNLSQNHFEGRIPQERQFNTFEVDSYLGNPELCGAPLPKKCENNRETDPNSVQIEDTEDTESEFTWKVGMIGYGCGTLLGVLMGYIMFSTGRPKWFNENYDTLEHMIFKQNRNKRRYA